jgi:hypothetical protein
MNEAELATKTATLPELFADRLPASALHGLRAMADGGEWGELLDLLMATLQQTDTAVSDAERNELRCVLAGWGLPTDHVDGLAARE